MYLLDSNICIDFMRGELPYAYDMMRNSSPKLFKIPAIVEGELRLGIEKSKQPEKARWLVDEFTLPFEVVPTTWTNSSACRGCPWNAGTRWSGTDKRPSACIKVYNKWFALPIP